jgi:putative membrane protein
MSIARSLATIGTMLLGFRASEALAQPTQAPFYGPHMGDGPWHAWFLGPLFMIGFFFLAALIVVLLVRWLVGGHASGGQRHGAADSHRKTPVDILKERFAKGEIDKEEFEERRRVLED